jgi:uncharacterized protein YecE (DUF72 family)
MEFGRVPETALNNVDFSLPGEPAGNAEILKIAKKEGHKPQVYFGCAKWGRKEWVGKIYPKGTKDGQFLDHYVHHYNSIELNATHYKINTPAEIKKWADKAKSRHFKFCPKVPQLISHYSAFKNTEQLTTSFLEGILAFENHLGPVFLQVSDKYSPARRDVLYSYLRSLPTDVQFFLEVRHPDWFAHKAIMKELLQTLAELNVGFIITDTAGRRDCAHMNLTIPKAFIRYVGNSLHATDFTRTDEWINRLKHWVDNGIEEIYFFIHMHDEATSPELTVYMVDKLNAACGLNLIKPKFENGDPKF